MCSTLISGRLQLLLGQGQVLPRNRLLCCPALKSSSAAARLNTLHVTHKALRSCPIHAPGRRHVTATPSALPAAATAATAAFSPWSTLAVLCSCAAAAQIVEDHTSWGKLLSAPLLTLLLALGAAALGLLPPTSAVYDIVWSHLMPLAIALFLLDHDVSNIRTVGGPVLASFLLGAGTMIAGAAAAWLLCKPSMAAAAGTTAAAAKLAACLVASYIGGSVNFIAVAAATQLPTGLVPGAMAADNLGMLLALGLLMAVPLRFLHQQQQQRQLAFAGVPAQPYSSSGGSSGGRVKQQPQPQRRRTARPTAAAAAGGTGPATGPAGSAQPNGTGPLALDGSPLLTEPPSQFEVAACLEETSHGDNHTRMLPVLPPRPKEGIVAPLTYSSSGSGSGSSSDEDWTEWKALDGSPLLTEPPSQAEVATYLEEISQGDNYTRMLPVLPRVGDSSSSSSSSSGRGGSGGSGGSSSDEDWVEWVALDGSPLLTEPPTPLEVATVLDGIRHGDNHTRVLPISVGGKRSSSSSSSSSSVDDGRVALDGSPLLTEPPSELEVAAALEEISHGDNHTRVLPVLPKLKNGGSSRGGSSSNGTVPASPAAAAAAAAQGVVVGKCGGCPGSGVTARDNNPLLTRVPSMGDGIATITAAKHGGMQIRTPPKPPSASSFTTSFGRTAAAAISSSNGSSGSGSTGYNSQRGSDGLIVGCGGCSEALDAIAATSPLPAAVAAGGWSGSSAATAANDSSSSSSGSGALALDGSMLLTEPDTSRLEAAVAAARKGGSNGSSVAVSPVVSGEFELLVKLDKDSLMQRLRRQQRKHKQQQQNQRAAAAIAAANSSSYDSSSDSSSSSSDDEDMLALDGSRLLTQPPSQDEVTVCVEGASQGDNQTRVLPVLPRVDNSSSSSSSINTVTSDSSNSASSNSGLMRIHKGGSEAATAAVSSSSSSSSSSVLTASTAAAAVAAASVAAAAAHELTTMLGTPALHQLFLAAMAVGISIAAAAFSKMQQLSAAEAVAGPGPFAGASQLGQVLIGVFFAALGASCCCPLSTLACCLPLLAFVTVMTVSHWALLWGVGGRVLGLQPEVLLCGSAAAIGGPATAAGLATAKGWGQLVQPSLLCGSLGYALGTGAGLLVAQGLGVLA